MENSLDPTALDYRRALTALRDGTLDLDALSRIDTYLNNAIPPNTEKERS